MQLEPCAVGDEHATSNVICQSPRYEEFICAALQELPVGLTSCHDDCQGSWWLGCDHVVAGSMPSTTLVVFYGCFRRLLQHMMRYMRSSYFVPAVTPVSYLLIKATHLVSTAVADACSLQR